MKKITLSIISSLIITLLTYNLGFTATKIFSDGFEDGTLDAWNYHDAGATVVSSEAHSGSKCVANNYYPVKNTFSYKILSPAPTSELYISFWIKVDSSFHDPTLGFKPLRILEQGQALQMEFWVQSDNWYLNGYYYGPATGENYYLSQRGSNPLVDHNWHRLETYIKYNTAGVSNGIHRIWWDGGLRFERTNVKFRSAGNGGVFFDKIDIPSNAGDGQHYSRLGDIIYIDDVEIWDGMPDSTTALRAPTGLMIVN